MTTPKIPAPAVATKTQDTQLRGEGYLHQIVQGLIYATNSGNLVAFTTYLMRLAEWYQTITAPSTSSSLYNDSRDRHSLVPYQNSDSIKTLLNEVDCDGLLLGDFNEGAKNNSVFLKLILVQADNPFKDVEDAAVEAKTPRDAEVARKKGVIEALLLPKSTKDTEAFKQLMTGTRIWMFLSGANYTFALMDAEGAYLHLREQKPKIDEDFFGPAATQRKDALQQVIDAQNNKLVAEAAALNAKFTLLRDTLDAILPVLQAKITNLDNRYMAILASGRITTTLEKKVSDKKSALNQTRAELTRISNTIDNLLTPREAESRTAQELAKLTKETEKILETNLYNKLKPYKEERGWLASVQEFFSDLWKLMRYGKQDALAHGKFSTKTTTTEVAKHITGVAKQINEAPEETRIPPRSMAGG